MASEEFDREDLMREATGLIDRVEYRVDFIDDPIVFGFRRDGSVSIFFGQARVYQFNNQNELRRGYLDNQLYKAERGGLVRLTRNRSDNQVQLIRHELSASEQDSFVASAVEFISNFKREILLGTAVVSQSVSAQPHEEHGNKTDTAVKRITNWLTEWPAEIKIAATPRLVTPKRKSR